MLKRLDFELFDQVLVQAEASPRHRMHYDLRDSVEEESQRMLNVLEPGTVVPIHRHRNTSGTVVIVRGILVERLYDDEGNVTEEVLMVPGGANPVVQVEKGRWHSLECLERILFSLRRRMELGSRWQMKIY